MTGDGRRIAIKLLRADDPAPQVFTKPEITLGTSSSCDVRLRDGADAVHCLVAQTARGYMVEDLDSSSGTFVKKRRVRQAFVDPGVPIRAGRDTFVLLPT